MYTNANTSGAQLVQLKVFENWQVHFYCTLIVFTALHCFLPVTLNHHSHWLCHHPKHKRMRKTHCLGWRTTARTDFLWFVKVTRVFPATKSQSRMVVSWLPTMKTKNSRNQHINSATITTLIRQTNLCMWKETKILYFLWKEDTNAFLDKICWVVVDFYAAWNSKTI